MSVGRTNSEIDQLQSRHDRGPTIRLKLTLWYGSLFLIAGVLLIAINFLLVRDSLVPAPGNAREYVEQLYGLEPGILEQTDRRSAPGVHREIYIMVDGEAIPVSIPALLADAQEQLKDEALEQLWTWSLVALGLMTVITFGSAWVLAGRMLKPIHAITATARRLSGSTLHERIALRGPRDELKDLADTFDAMLGRLDTAFTAQREFVANASHELRTPLTIIRTEIDVALADPDISPTELQEMGAAITDAVLRSERLIDGLLVLARADECPLTSELDLADIAQQEVAAASSQADDLGLRLDLDLRSALVMGERALLERLVANLVENAIRHNVKDGWFSVKTWAEGEQAHLEVANGGPVIPSDDLQRLFERFYRPDRSRSRQTGGFGLGLSIVKSVVAAHKGVVELRASEEGGLLAKVTLPSAGLHDRDDDHKDT